MGGQFPGVIQGHVYKEGIIPSKVHATSSLKTDIEIGYDIPCYHNMGRGMGSGVISVIQTLKRSFELLITSGPGCENLWEPGVAWPYRQHLHCQSSEGKMSFS